MNGDGTVSISELNPEDDAYPSWAPFLRFDSYYLFYGENFFARMCCLTVRIFQD